MKFYSFHFLSFCANETHNTCLPSILLFLQPIQLCSWLTEEIDLDMLKKTQTVGRGIVLHPFPRRYSPKSETPLRPIYNPM